VSARTSTSASGGAKDGSTADPPQPIASHNNIT
jgi:hypothetical protein